MDRNQLEQILRSVMKKRWPGQPENDNISMAHASATLGIYTLGKDSQKQPGVSEGTMVEKTMVSNIYPNSTHKYQIYVPADYNGEDPLPYMIFLDGISQYLAPTACTNVVLDNLIAQGRIPAMLAIFIEPGDMGDGMPIYAGEYGIDGSNRSEEYDSIDDRYARFLIEEILPEVGKEYKLSADPEMHCLCGISSGGQAVFNAAWHRPDVFRKVVCHVGSFTAIRGGDCNPERIRKNPAKPIRVFLQDGENDLNIIYGDWVLANKTMVSALEYRGYDYKYVLGKGGHNLEHGASIMPETLEWIWR